MLQWKPAISREATIALQQAIQSHPNEIDCAELYYYVTGEDCAREVGVADPAKVGLEQLGALFQDVGVNEVFVLWLRSKHVSGHFASATTLQNAGVQLPAWPDSVAALRPPDRRPRGRPRTAKP